MQIKEKDDIDSLKMKLQEISQLQEVTVNELQSLKSEHGNLLSEKVSLGYWNVKSDIGAEQISPLNVNSFNDIAFVT